MDMWNSYKKRAGAGFGSEQLRLCTGEKWNASLGRVSDKGVELGINAAMFQGYDEGRRYIIAKDITYDLLLTIYDVNSSSMFAARITGNPDTKEWSRIISMLRKVKIPNLEFRLIGLQNGYTAGLEAAESLNGKIRGRFVEFDLFGTNTRHVVVDAKTGVPYSLLLLNRIYRAGELACQTKKEDFEKNVAKLTFA